MCSWTKKKRTLKWRMRMTQISTRWLTCPSSCQLASPLPDLSQACISPALHQMSTRYLPGILHIYQVSARLLRAQVVTLDSVSAWGLWQMSTIMSVRSHGLTVHLSPSSWTYSSRRRPGCVLGWDWGWFLLHAPQGTTCGYWTGFTMHGLWGHVSSHLPPTQWQPLHRVQSPGQDSAVLWDPALAMYSAVLTCSISSFSYDLS